MEITLCHPGAGCPKVKIDKNKIEICNEKEKVILKPEEWNILIEKISQGELNKI